MDNLYVVVVVYNMDCNKSKTCTALLNSKVPLNVVVADNSTTSNRNEEICSLNNWKYLKMEGNVGLSKAYNRAVEYISLNNSEKDFWVSIFDQDTTLSEDYFQVLIDSIKNKPKAYVKVPLVRDDSGYLSPNLINGYSVKRIDSVDEIQDTRSITAINAGMAIYSKVFEKINYDEEFFLDYVDHNFVRNYKNNFNNDIEVINTTLRQSFSDDEHDNINGDIKRFKIYLCDFKLFCNKDFTGRIYYISKVIVRSLKLSINYKNFIFVSLLFKKKQRF
jgi:hypothetical protein